MLHLFCLESALPRWQKSSCCPQKVSVFHQTAGFLQEPSPEVHLGPRGWPILKWPGLLLKSEATWRGNQLSKAWKLPGKEMIRNLIPYTTSFRSVKCNKMCSTYTVINTFAWGSARSVRLQVLIASMNMNQYWQRDCPSFWKTGSS